VADSPKGTRKEARSKAAADSPKGTKKMSRAMDPYREPAPDALAKREASRQPHHVPLTRTQFRLQWGLLLLPVVVLFALTFVIDAPFKLLGTALAWTFVVWAWRYSVLSAHNKRLRAVVSMMLRDADPHLVARATEAIASDAHSYPGMHSAALMYLGIARARTGEIDRAIALLEAVERAGWLRARVQWLAWLWPWMAALYAARGDLELGERWLDTARARLPGEMHRFLLSTSALVLARRERYVEAVESLEMFLRETEGMTATARDHFQLLRAFALVQSGQPPPADEIRSLVAARLAAPGRSLPLERWWPEFAEFVAAHA
jgi:hypothetical protein